VQDRRSPRERLRCRAIAPLTAVRVITSSRQTTRASVGTVWANAIVSGMRGFRALRVRRGGCRDACAVMNAGAVEPGRALPLLLTSGSHDETASSVPRAAVLSRVGSVVPRGHARGMVRWAATRLACP
jgi:hypothetical protein